LAYYAKGWRKTLLIGDSTSGDLARKHDFRLPASEITVSISASLVYDQYGNLLSGKGTTPDLQLPLPQTLPWSKLLQALRLHFTKTPTVQ
jgi:C-terminal processing protease CtpA/Prc